MFSENCSTVKLTLFERAYSSVQMLPINLVMNCFKENFHFFRVIEANVLFSINVSPSFSSMWLSIWLKIVLGDLLVVCSHLTAVCFEFVVISQYLYSNQIISWLVHLSGLYPLAVNKTRVL